MSSSLLGNAKKALKSRLLIIPFITRFLGFYQQSYTLGGSLLPYRFVENSLLYYSYTPGHLLDLRSHLVPWAEHLLLLRWCLSSYKQWYCLNMMRLWDSKGSVNLLRFSCVLLTSLHILRDAFAEINPPAGLSSIRIPTLDRVWYHAPWWLHYRRYRRCGQLLFER